MYRFMARGRVPTGQLRKIDPAVTAIFKGTVGQEMYQTPSVPEDSIHREIRICLVYHGTPT